MDVKIDGVVIWDNLGVQATWTTETLNISAYYPGTINLEFQWIIGTFAGSDPPDAVDNVTVCRLVPDAILGVTYHDFYGYAQGENNVLHWSTENELNNDYFIVQKSVDGKNFTNLTKVKGGGLSINLLEYSATDFSVSSPYTYYRLKQVDFDGNVNYSETIEIRNDNHQKLITLIDDPLNGPRIEFDHFPVNGWSTVQIHDLSGRVIFETGIELEDGAAELISQDFDRLKSGVYFIVVSNGQFSTSEKVSVIRD